MAATGRKPTAAAPKPERHGYRCYARAEDGSYICGVDPADPTKPKLIDGGSSEATAQAALDRHRWLMHPSPVQLAASRRVPTQRMPWRRRPQVSGPSI